MVRVSSVKVHCAALMKPRRLQPFRSYFEKHGGAHNWKSEGLCAAIDEALEFERNGIVPLAMLMITNDHTITTELPVLADETTVTANTHESLEASRCTTFVPVSL